LSYSVNWHEKAIDDLKLVDKRSAKRILEKIKTYLAQDPLLLGKLLKGIFEGLYRYRFGDYRIIYALDQEEKSVLVLRIGARKEVYNRKL
jgi:mRNA interferase RelE/StbE